MAGFNFKKYEGIGSRISNYSISYGPSRTFFFSSGFCSRENIKKFSRVVLFYDKNKHAVAFQFLTENPSGAFALIKPSGQNTAAVSAHSFIVANELNKKEYYGRKTPIKIKDDKFGDMFVIELLKQDNAY